MSESFTEINKPIVTSNNVIDSIEGYVIEGVNVSENLESIEDAEIEDAAIDRDVENESVVSFQKSGDVKILEEVYKKRIKTLKNWAHRHYFPGLTISLEDFYEELTVVFLKAAEKYNPKRGSFNTCLWTFLDYRIKNIKNSRHAKKRSSEIYDGPMSGMVLSLDYTYGNNEGSEVTLKDLLSAQDIEPEKPTATDAIALEETISLFVEEEEEDEEVLRGFFIKISMGSSLASLLREYRTKRGKLKLSQDNAIKLGGKRRCNRVVTNLIKENTNMEDFKLIEYSVNKITLNYIVEMDKTDETDLIMRTIRNLRKNKKYYCEKLGVEDFFV